jgi:4-methyl-5(b-hydroxyethyl)-thiazole monophosphate biosynthesis
MKRILLLLANGFEPMEASCFTDILGWANIDGSEKIELVSVGLRSPIKAAFGFSVIPDKLLSEIDIMQFDALAMPGGFEETGFYEDAYCEEFLDVIRHFEASGKTIATVCVASLPLGKAGIINNRRATIYHSVNGTRKEELEDFGAIFVDNAVVIDKNLITSTGPGTGIEVAFELLTELTSKENSKHIRSLMRIPEPGLSWRYSRQVNATSSRYPKRVS